MVEKVFGGGLERTHRQHTGAGNENIDFPKFFDCLLDQLFDLGDFADVCFDCEGLVYAD